MYDKVHDYSTPIENEEKYQIENELEQCSNKYMDINNTPFHTKLSLTEGEKKLL